MDDIVKQAMAKWPNVPACYGWLGLDERGDWYMRDDKAQRLGRFDSGTPGAKGSRLRHDKLIGFINRNYTVDEAGRWYFQNGPQRVYVELTAAPCVCRVGNEAHGFAVTAHTGERVSCDAVLVDERGWVYLQLEAFAGAQHVLGLVHSQDVLAASEGIDKGCWQVETCESIELTTRFGFVTSPQFAQI